MAHRPDDFKQIKKNLARTRKHTSTKALAVEVDHVLTSFWGTGLEHAVGPKYELGVVPVIPPELLSPDQRPGIWFTDDEEAKELRFCKFCWSMNIRGGQGRDISHRLYNDARRASEDSDMAGATLSRRHYCTYSHLRPISDHYT